MRRPAVVALRDRFVLIAALACLAGYVYVYASGRQDTPVRSDAFSYYVYLPSWLLFHDPTLQPVADDCCGGAFPAWTGIYRAPRRRWWIDWHPIGEAVLIAPFFIVASGLTRWSNLTPNGYSLYYVHAAGLAGLCYAIAGLWFLRRLLLRHFTPGVTLATLVVILTGTSLYHYATYDSAFSHAFSFALVSALLERLDAARVDRASDAVLLGALAGFVVLVRHTNAIIPIVFVGAAIASRPIVDVLERARSLVIALLTAMLIVSPQLWLYHAATGRWLINAYADQGFTFASPHVGGVLWSPQKGVFFYAPVLLVAVAGLTLLPRTLRGWRAPAFVLLALHTYLVASWWDWQFGASFGHRAFIDVYPVFALGLASAFGKVASHPRARLAAALPIAALCALSMFQMLQYWHGVLPAVNLTWPGYRDLFLKPW